MKRSAASRLPLAIWLVNVLLVVLSYVRNMEWAIVPMFAAVLIEWGVSVKRLQRNSQAGGNCSAWAAAAAVVSVAYAVVNFFLCIMQLWEGGPEISDGVYCLWNHGFIREITFEEYSRLQIVEGRLFVGHSLAFSGLSLLFLWQEKD